MARKKSIQDIREQMRRITGMVSSVNRSAGQRMRRARANDNVGEVYNQWKRSRTAVQRGTRALEAGSRYMNNIYNQRGGWVGTNEYKRYAQSTYMGNANG